MKSLPEFSQLANAEDTLSRIRSSVERALAPARPANDDHTPALSNATARAVQMARLHLRTGNPAAYARSIAGEHRAANNRQQRALEAVIASDGQEQLFVRHPANGCLLAKES